jgi:hypothetical protein
VTPVFGPDRQDDFISLLKPADILVFDKFSLPGGLVQWADECPVNHAALVIDDTYSIEANRDHGNSKAPAVRQVRTSSYFGDKCNRTITILRHKHLQDDPTRSAGKVVAQAKRYDGDVRYAYLDVIPVGLLALQRMYGRELAKKLGWTYEPIMNMIALRLRSCLDDDKMTMMCSEYIYRCFTESEAELAIEVVDPLNTFDSARRHLRLLRTTFAADHEVAAGASSEVEGLWRELLSRKYAPIPGGGLRPLTGFTDRTLTGNPGDPLPDAVSPGDLWRSASLIPIASFHRPPERPWVRAGEDAVATAQDQLIVDPG